MNKEVYKLVRNNPNYKELIKKRSSFAWTLSAIIFTVYCSFVMLIAFSPETLGRPIGNSVITVGIPMGISIILFSIILTGIYVKRANSEFDKLIDNIRDDIRFES